MPSRSATPSTARWAEKHGLEDGIFGLPSRSATPSTARWAEKHDLEDGIDGRRAAE